MDDDKIEGLSDDDVKVAKSHPKAWAILRAQEKKWKEQAKTSTAALEAKIAELSKKPAPTAADTEKLARLEMQLAEREGELKSYRSKLEERDYRESKEYSEKFVQPFNNGFQKARAFVAELQVLNEDGQPERAATPQDFDAIYEAKPQQRYALAKKMFGPDVAFEVVSFAKDLQSLNERAREAVTAHAANYEKISAERATASERERQAYAQHVNDAKAALDEAHPAHFSLAHYDSSPELKAALQSGYDEVDALNPEMLAKLSPEDRAAASAVVRGKAAAFNLHVAQLQAATKEIETLKAELVKYRGSDPGAATPAAAPAAATDEPIGGIEAMAAKFGKLTAE